MNEELWSDIDRYFADRLLPADAVLSAALANNTAAGLPPIDVSPPQGKFLYLLAKLQGAKRILEIGTLGGYSTIWLARALPADGVVVTLELEPKHAEVARQNISQAGLSARVRIVVGKALESLDALRRAGEAPFDLVFIDADKVNTQNYFSCALELCRPGAVIVTDNVVRKGQIVNEKSGDPNVRGMQKFFDALAKESRVEATGLQTVGSKGHDGFVLARVRG